MNQIAFEKFSVPHLIKTLQHYYYNSVLIARQSSSCGPQDQTTKFTKSLFSARHFSLPLGPLNIAVHQLLVPYKPVSQGESLSALIAHNPVLSMAAKKVMP